MGAVGRIACIATPYLLTIGALISLIYVELGSTDSKSSVLNELYFLRVDLSNLTLAANNSTLSDQLITLAENAIGNKTETKDLLNSLEQAGKDSALRDFYDIGLWGYCAGNTTSNGDFNVDFCSPRRAEFYFNPVEVWGLDKGGLDTLLPDTLTKEVEVYRKVSKWMFIAYQIAIGTTAIELLIGLTAILSRLGSLATSIVSAVSTLFTVASAVTATALFAVLDGVFSTALKPYEVRSSLGTRMLAVTWIAVAFSLASGFFWLLSSCCCSGRSPFHNNRPNRRGRGIVAEKAPYTYERVSSPYQGHEGVTHPGPGPVVPLQSHGQQDAYEPFRHV